jgi:hypothetical protein
MTEIEALKARIAALEARLAVLESRTPPTSGWQWQKPDCGCPVNSVCMNVACPRAMRVTCAVSTQRIEQ